MMSRTRNTAFALILSIVGGSIVPGAMQAAYAEGEQAPQEASKEKAVSAEVGKPYQEAQALIKDKKYQEALAKLDSITVEKKTPYETFIIDRARLAIAALTNDDKLAAEVFPRVIDSGQLAAAEQLPFIEALANVYLRKQDYPQAIIWLQRYFKEGGKDPKVHDLLVRTYYIAGDYVHAGEELRLDVAAAEKAGTAPSDQQLRILYSVAVKQNDKQAQVATLEKLVTYYPKKDVWTDLLNRLQTRPNFPERLLLDEYRLKFAIGLVESAGQYAEMADLAQRAGFSAEAKKVLEAGYKAGVLRDGPEFAQQKQLLAQATKSAADDLRTSAQTESEVKKSKDGLGLINLGFSYVTNDQFDKGLGLMEQGIAVGGVKRMEEAKLHLATAYALAGRNENAIKEFKTVQGSDGTADLARYWALQLTNPMH